MNIHSNYFTYIPIFVSTLALGVFIFYKNFKSKINQALAGLVMSVAVWVFALIFADTGTNEKLVLLWSKLAIIGPAFIPVSFLFFTLFYPEEKKIALWKKIVLFAPAFFFVLTSLSSFNVKSIKIEKWGADLETGPAYYFLFGYFILWMGAGFYNLIKSYKLTANAVVKTQIKYAFGAVFLAFIIGTTTNLVLVVLNVSQYSILGPFAALVLASIIAFAIFRYRFLDIRIIVKSSTTYIFSLIAAILISIGFWLLINNYANLNTLTTGIISLTIGIIVFNPIKVGFEKLANKYFFQSFYSYQKTIKGISDKLTSILDIEKVAEEIFNAISKTMRIEKMAVLVKDLKKNKYYVQKIAEFSEEDGLDFSDDLFLIEYLTFTKRMLVRDEIEGLASQEKDYYSRKELLKIKRKMGEKEVAAFLPAISKDELIGLVILGDKISKESFSVSDVELLETLTNQGAVAIENAKLYEEVRQFNIKLREEVERQTEALKRANKNLKRMDQMKSEFVSIVSHQLRTPLSGIKGYLYMLTEGDFGKLPAQIQKILLEVRENTDKLIRLIRDFLDISQIESETLRLDIKPNLIEPIIEKAINEVMPAAEKKGLKIIFEKPQEKFPKVLIDNDKTLEIIINLIDNAIKYTGKGQITISGKVDSVPLAALKVQGRDKDKKEFILSVKDTGIGIEQGEAGQLFQKFVRGRTISTTHPGGRGLGLYIVKMLAEAQGGRTWVESEGLNKGSTFFVSLALG